MCFAGFDTSIYPGDATMAAGKAALPYVFCGYYLKSPCHPGSTWAGKRAQLVAAGWHCLIIYVGQQVPGVSPCHKNVLTAAQGALDGSQAAALTKAEGFPAGSSIYLDVEAFDLNDPGVPALKTYIAAWVTQVLTTAYQAAIYCHVKDAALLRPVVIAAGGTANTRFWVVGTGTVPFTVTAAPTGSGISFATTWQNPTSLMQKFGVTNVNIDQDVSNFADPSAPA